MSSRCSRPGATPATPATSTSPPNSGTAAATSASLLHNFMHGIDQAAQTFLGVPTPPRAARAAAAAAAPSPFQNATAPSSFDRPPTFPPPPTTTIIPPASARVLRQLPTVAVRPDDLVDEMNRECCCCMDEIAIGCKATRLPCAHLFHPHCITAWLQRHCTCPICRYELPTDDVAFERGRLQRMQCRKPRYARHDLQRLSIAELKQIVRQHLPMAQPRSFRLSRDDSMAHEERRVEIALARMVEKSEVVDYVIKSGAIDLIPTLAEPTVNHLAYTLSHLRSMRVAELKRVMNDDAGVFFDVKDVVEKEDMIQILVHSGRLDVLPEKESSAAESVESTPSPEDRKPAAVNRREQASARRFDNPPTTIAVETVEDDDVDVGATVNDNAHIASPRHHTEWVLEEDTSYIPPPPLAQQQQPARAPLSATISSSESLSTSESLHSYSSNSNHTAATTTMATSGLSCEGYFANLSLHELKDTAARLGVDASDYIAQRERLDRDIMQKLADAAAASAATASLSNTGDAASASFNNSPARQARMSKRRRFDSNGDEEDADNEAEEVNVPPTTVPAPQTESNAPCDATVASTNTVASLFATAFENWSVSHLRTLAAHIPVDLSSTSSDRDSMAAVVESALSVHPQAAQWAGYVAAFGRLSPLGIAELREVARELHVSLDDCIERGDMLHTIVQALQEQQQRNQQQRASRSSV